MEINSKDSFVKELGEFITSAENRVEHMLSQLRWSKESVAENSKRHENESGKMVSCEFNPDHAMPLKSLEHHHEVCSWLNDGYTEQDVKDQLPSSHFFYENSSCVTSVLIDENLQNEILTRKHYEEAQSSGNAWTFQLNCSKKVPRTMSRAATELSVSERLAIYDYVASQGRIEAKIKLEDLHLLSDDKSDAMPKEKSHLEILAEQRDYKRRRQSYRAKNVHITKKSYTEVLRDVIHNHTQALYPQGLDEEPIPSSAPKQETVKVESPPHDDRSRYRRRSTSRAREMNTRQSSDHRHQHRKSGSRDRDSSKRRHKSKKGKHKHKSDKKSHKREHHRHSESDTDSK